MLFEKLGKFAIMLFILILAIMLSPLLYDIMGATMTEMSCSSDYSVSCFVVNFSLPLVLLVILFMAITYFQKERSS